MSSVSLESLRNLLENDQAVQIVRSSRKWSLIDGPGAEAFYVAGLACRQLLWLEEAVANFQSALILDPWAGQYWARAGDAWYELRQLELAEDAWARAAALGSLDAHSERLRIAATHAREGTIPDRAEVTPAGGGPGRIASGRNPAVPVGAEPLVPVDSSLGTDRRDQVSLQIYGTPNPEITPVILNVLRHRRVTAAFFVAGDKADPAVVGRIAAENHHLYNGGYSGTAFTELDDHTIFGELRQTEELLSRFRPPPAPYPVRLPHGAGCDDPRVHAVLRRFNPNVRIVQGVPARDHQVANRFLDDADVELAARLCSLELVCGLDSPGPMVVAHDHHGTGGIQNAAFVREFFENLITQLTELDFSFAMPPSDDAVQTEPGASAPDAAVENLPRPKIWAVATRPRLDILRIDRSNIDTIEAEFALNGLPMHTYRDTIRWPWINHDRAYAHALVHGGRFVGWVQSIYARRPLDGRLQTVCNLSSWYVLEEFGEARIRLLFRAIADAGDIPVTALTLSGSATQIYRALQFHVLDSERYALPLRHDSDLLALSDIDKASPALDAVARQVYRDHRGLAVQHCTIASGSSWCYFIYQTRDRFDLRVADLLYVSGDRELLLSGQWRPPTGSELAECQQLLIDARFVEDLKPNLELMNPFNPRFFKGAAHLRPQLDFMYSEIALRPQSLL